MDICKRNWEGVMSRKKIMVRVFYCDVRGTCKKFPAEVDEDAFGRTAFHLRGDRSGQSLRLKRWSRRCRHAVRTRKDTSDCVF